MSDARKGWEHPAEQFKRLSEDLFNMAATSLAQAEASGTPFFPMLLPFYERNRESNVEGPGELITIASSDADDAFERAVNTIYEHAQQWVGYIFVRKAQVHVSDVARDALLLEAWFYDKCMHVIRRFETNEAGIAWLEGPAMVTSQNPPTHLLTPTRVVAPDGFAMVKDLLGSLAAASTEGLTGDCQRDWTTRVSAVQLPSEEVAVPSYTWADLARNMAQLDKLHAMRAPAVIFEAKMDVACTQLEAMATITPESGCCL